MGLELVRPGSVDAGQVRDAVQAARDAVDMAMGAIALAIRKVVFAGEVMIKGKEDVGHGAFLEWLAAEGIVGTEPDQMSKTTAERWMGLARFHRKSPAELEKCSSLTQAYRLAGLLPEPDAAAGPGGGGESGSYLATLARTHETLSAQLQARPLQLWPREDLKQLKARLRPFADVYEQAEHLLEGQWPPR